MSKGRNGPEARERKQARDRSQPASLTPPRAPFHSDGNRYARGSEGTTCPLAPRGASGWEIGPVTDSAIRPVTGPGTGRVIGAATDPAIGPVTGPTIGRVIDPMIGSVTRPVTDPTTGGLTGRMTVRKSAGVTGGETLRVTDPHPAPGNDGAGAGNTPAWSMDPPIARGSPERDPLLHWGAIPVRPGGLNRGALPAAPQSGALMPKPAALRRIAALALLVVAMPLALTVMTAPPASAAETAQRIVSVGGSVTEVIYALGAQDRVIARDSTSTFPPEVTNLPDVGYVRALSPEGLLAVNPDLILAEDGAGPPETVAQLKAAAVPFVTVPNGWTAEAVGAKIRAVGEALGLESRAETLAADVTRQIAAASDAAAARPGPKPRALFVLSTQGGRIMASGTGTQAAGILALAGAENAVTEFPGYKPLTDEAVIAAAPDVIVMMDRGGDHGATAETLFALPAMALTPAGKTRALVRMDGLYLLGFGPRTGAAVEELSRALHAATDG